VRVAEQAEIAHDGAGVDRLGDENPVRPPGGCRGIDLLTRGQSEAEVLERRRSGRRLGRDLEEHQYEVRPLLSLAQPHDPRAPVAALVDDVETRMLAVEGDGPVEVADPERQVREDRLHVSRSATRAASASASAVRSSGSSAPAAAACPPPPRALASRDRSTSQSAERRRLTARPLAS